LLTSNNIMVRVNPCFGTVGVGTTGGDERQK